MAVANSVLVRLRVLGRIYQMKPIQMVTQPPPHRIEFLNDDGSELPLIVGIARARTAASFSAQVAAVTAEMWECVNEIDPAWQQPAWDALLLDAVDLLTHGPAALVLAHSALETMVEHVPASLAPAAVEPSGLWEWINDRGDYRKEPSTREQLDQLLRFLAGVSLKDEVRLWDGYKNLASARNSFVHDGVARVGRDEVTPTRAAELVALAGEIVDWLERLLPPQEQRPRGTFITEWQITQPFAGSDTEVELPT